MTTLTSPTGTARLFPEPEVPIHTTGLVIDPDTGRLTMASLPSLTGLFEPPEPSHGAGEDEIVVRGMAFHQGASYIVSADRHTIDVVDCDGGHRRFGFASFAVATGLAAVGGTLLVADRMAGTVDGYDLGSAQLTMRWTGLPEPEDLVAIDDGVLVAAADGVRQLTVSGRSRLVRPLARPRSVTWTGTTVVVGGDDGVILLTDLDDSDFDTDLPDALLTGLDGPYLARWGSDRLYLSAPSRGVVRALLLEPPSLLGDLAGEVAATGLGVDEAGGLWVATPDGAAAANSEQTVPSAWLRAGPVPITVDPGDANLARVRARGWFGSAAVTIDVQFDGPGTGSGPSDPLPIAGADRLVAVPSQATAASVVVAIDTDATAPWQEPVPWIDLVELRLNEPGLIDHLPEIYRSQGEPAVFLDPFLRLLATGFDDLVERLEALPDQFDPSTAVDDLDGERWLDWLATWVDVSLDETWPTEQRRRVVAEAFDWHSRRGTPEAIQRRVALEHGVEVTIAEPADQADVWILGADNSVLGETTMTIAAPFEGSILDRTAVVERSHLIGPADHGAPLFGDLAHRFRVEVRAADAQPGLVDRIAATVEREKPAHTHVHICVQTPGITIGIGGRVGLDMIAVAEPGDPAAFTGDYLSEF